MAATHELDLATLCQLTGVTVRTVRYYVQQGLLPSPGAGPNARYGAVHLERLRLIRRMQREHLPLAEIRHRLASLDPTATAPQPAAPQPAAAEGAAPRPGASLVEDYVRTVLGGAAPPMVSRPALTSALAPTRSQWDRIALSPDVELHVRRPLSRDDNRRVEHLLEAAARILHQP
ncbi:MAG: hypothetical protein A2138_11255 [Deltaproteobacteria bacterium RBG_16_71_12]|nr:MAG: hypothetical protein A2138_11255 [Deltaproteobacteria bacterium RBG_16_71_12]